MGTSVIINNITLTNVDNYNLDLRSPIKLNIEDNTIHIQGFIFRKDDKKINKIYYTSKSLFNRQVIGNATLNDSPIFAKSFPEFYTAQKSRFESKIFPSFLAPNDSIYIHAKMDDNREDVVARIDISVKSDIVNSYKEQISPIKLLSLGRTGTTLFMNMISAHPNVGINNHYNESNISSYYLNNIKYTYPFVQKNNFGEGKANLMNIETIENNAFMEFPFITNDNWYTDLFPKKLVTFVKSTIDDYYLNASPDKNINHFIEKGVVHDPTLTLMDQLYPNSKYIFLVRDFRDMYASIINFNQKRGFRAFGMENYENDTDYIIALGKYCENSFIKSYEALKNRAILVKYEDLILDKRSTLKSIFEYLKIDSSDTVLDDIMDKTSGKSKEEQKHMTTSDVSKSIGKYEDSLDKYTIELLNKSFSKSLKYFGYLEGEE